MMFNINFKQSFFLIYQNTQKQKQKKKLSLNNLMSSNDKICGLFNNRYLKSNKDEEYSQIINGRTNLIGPFGYSL